MAHVTKHPTMPQYRVKIGLMPDFSGSNQVRQEEPVGSRDGANKAYILNHEPTRNTEWVYKDGMYMRKGAGYDYMISGKTITFNEAPPIKAVILVDYKYEEDVS